MKKLQESYDMLRPLRPTKEKGKKKKKKKSSSSVGGSNSRSSGGSNSDGGGGGHSSDSSEEVKGLRDIFQTFAMKYEVFLYHNSELKTKVFKGDKSCEYQRESTWKSLKLLNSEGKILGVIECHKEEKHLMIQ
ncbi:Hypothetical predicted protein [Octopus vulgaris]|uniref:Uncharacterized protein n=1 Tax=Octopus vulgaris TaxID=6645 RepID=A0AA36ARV7_OCTVU|nr:Hypothetical predicted protein [Octopus vulgaris]